MENTTNVVSIQACRQNREIAYLTSLAREYIAINQPLVNKIFVKFYGNGIYEIYDESLIKFTISRKAAPPFNDFLLTTLLNLAPRQIILFASKNSCNMPIVSLIKKIFGNKFKLIIEN